MAENTQSKHKKHKHKNRKPRKPRQGDGFFSLEQRARLVQS